MLDILKVNAVAARGYLPPGANVVRASIPPNLDTKLGAFIPPPFPLEVKPLESS